MLELHILEKTMFLLYAHVNFAFWFAKFKIKLMRSLN